MNINNNPSTFNSFNILKKVGALVLVTLIIAFYALSINFLLS
ncbi:hypothetical protein HJ01_00013 [Flavobacterium frigoris PS1]|uniref:Uncharacterized protein n=1 Tax=Flavobacterium frigoris (strain PS1) TaxID=1086011 RepID=H7FLG5_FLAFP|nr:hypothetical protein HJ01_00013 [Flavobacterium frigoris PS1]